MLVAVRTLWGFYHANKENFVELYFIKRQKEENEISNLDPELRLAQEMTTLNYYRRVVLNYYLLIAGSYELGIITQKALSTYFLEKDMSIIPLIILPIEKELAKKLGEAPDLENPTLARLQNLYDDFQANAA